MKSQPCLRYSFLFLILISLNACENDEAVNKQEQVLDEDMVAATALADEYLSSQGGRSEKSEKSITILKFKQDELLYHTNGGYNSGYDEINEETITTVALPGEYIFWYRGGGLSDLEEIEFDATSQSLLDDLPEEFNKDKMWVIQIPEDAIPGSILKYDIVYQPKSSDSFVRLDPKIQIGQ